MNLHKNKIFHQTVVNYVLTHKISVIVLLLLVTILAGVLASKVEYDNTLETYFFDSDLDEYNLFLDQFGTDEFIALSFNDKDIFTIDNLRLIDSMSRKLEKFNHVKRILSLTDINIITGSEGYTSFTKLINDFPESEEDVQIIKEKALNDTFLPGTIISRDAKYTAVVAEIDHIVGEFDYKMEMLKEIRAYKDELEKSTGKKFYIGGSPVLDDAFFRYNKRDQQTLIPIMILIICLIAWAMFRKLRFVFLLLTIVTLAVIWTYGLLVLFGYKINAVATIIPLILMGSGIAGSMHIVTEYIKEVSNENTDKIQSIKNAFSNVIKPTFLTSLTTVFGLLSLFVADLEPIKQLGIISAFGVLFTFIITFFLSPVILTLLPIPVKAYQAQIGSGPIFRFIYYLSKWERKRAIFIISIVSILFIPAVISLSNLDVGTNSLDYYREDDPVRSQVEWIDTHLGGTHSLEFYIETGKENLLKNPNFLKKIENFENYLIQFTGITKVYSIVDMVKTLNKSFKSGDNNEFTIPGSQNEIAQQLFVIEGTEDMEALVSNDYSKGRIIARVAMNMSQEIGHHIPAIKDKIKEIFGTQIKVLPTGIVYLMNRVESYLLISQIKSFLLAFLVITISILIMLRSVLTGLLAMIPNLLPIFFSMAIMPLLGISLDVGTVMVAAIALGLVVDDTIHFLSRFNKELQKTKDYKIAIKNTIINVGRPIIYTSIVLGLGFSVLLFASFNPLVHFGILASIVIIIALWFDLVFLPSMLGFLKFKANNKKKLSETDK